MDSKKKVEAEEEYKKDVRRRRRKIREGEGEQCNNL